MDRRQPFPKPSPELVARFESVFPGPPARARQMFGHPAGFVNGNMFMGLFGDGLFVRLPEDERATAMKAGAKTFEPMAGRPIREYVVMQPNVVASSAKLKVWVARAMAYAETLPAKRPQKPKAGR
jgi:TfoX/Sxy family transcriptional regulator of competence genes